MRTAIADVVAYCAQVIDPHTHQYLDRLKDEPLFLALAQKVRAPSWLSAPALLAVPCIVSIQHKGSGISALQKACHVVYRRCAVRLFNAVEAT